MTTEIPYDQLWIKSKAHETDQAIMDMGAEIKKLRDEFIKLRTEIDIIHSKLAYDSDTELL